MIRATLFCALALTLAAAQPASANDEPDACPAWNDSGYAEHYGFGSCDSDQGFVQRLFNFRPWTAQSRYMRSVGTPGLPRGRRYLGGRYFGQFNNRYYGPQYGNF